MISLIPLIFRIRCLFKRHAWIFEQEDTSINCAFCKKKQILWGIRVNGTALRNFPGGIKWRE